MAAAVVDSSGAEAERRSQPHDAPQAKEDAMARLDAHAYGHANSHHAHSAAPLAAQPADLRCCCGRDECVFLRHNCSVLLSVERDVHTAAKMGQTLLARHEAYMASAERDRVELIGRIEQLEHDNADLEAHNKEADSETHSLRDELDQLNETVKDADTKIELLEATLRDSQREVRRLEGAAARAAELERQIAMLEEEQAELRNTVVHTQEEARTAMYRWRQAERGLNNLQDQLERMEKEAREERERHVEIIGRMERQRVMERELNTAAGRLKGAAAAKSMTDSKNSSNVVSHFVRDLLQDNATLQLGISELREMLVNSNDEIQMLREQLLYHQPAETHGGTPSTLRAELEMKDPPPPSPAKVSQELHVHHHYHVTHKPEAKKGLKKKRQGLTSGTFTPPHNSVPSTPRLQPLTWQHRGAPYHTVKESTATLSMPHNGRWSLLSEAPSEFAPSSVPSSPRSYNRNSILFDRSIMDTSLPASPTTSVDPMSPAWRGSHKKRPSELSGRSISAMAMFPKESANSRAGGPPSAYPHHPHPLTDLVLGDFSRNHNHNTTLYTTDDVPELTRNAHSADDTTIDTFSTDTDGNDPLSPGFAPESEDQFDPMMEQRPRRLRRVVSHESIMSLSNGMDIHTLKARPSQLTLRPLGLTAAGTNLSAVTARPTISRGGTDGRKGSLNLRDNLYGLSLPRVRDGNRTVSGPTKNATRQPSSGALGRIVSWRPWGGSNASSHPSPEPSPVTTPILSAITTIPALLNPAVALGGDKVSPQGSMSSTATFRAPGINQPGTIPGFNEYWAAHQRRGPPTKVAPDDVHQIQEAIREALQDA
ncbi:hypothetical protein B0H63DRAFT_64392 [Podospora didyma]|uniref:Uncharacterized protein n=1 Tax=Podospora didyma TaxID=330526 RepID=A0AAE0P848_9PEZI|nr:hypothetical protein B0H63DRAFT_64392 [Podospora didyma]